MTVPNRTSLDIQELVSVCALIPGVVTNLQVKDPDQDKETKGVKFTKFNIIQPDGTPVPVSDFHDKRGAIENGDAVIARCKVTAHGGYLNYNLLEVFKKVKPTVESSLKKLFTDPDFSIESLVGALPTAQVEELKKVMRDKSNKRSRDDFNKGN